MFQRIIDHRSTIIPPPKHLSLCAEYLWKPSGKDQQFLRTNCELTTYAIKDLLTPGDADCIWDYADQLPYPPPQAFEIIFGEPGGEDHCMFVIDNKLYQSYAFIHEVRESPFDPNLPLWQQVSHNPQKYVDSPIYFYICKNLPNIKELF